MPNAFAFVLGFSVVFTVLGVAAYFVAGPLRDNLPLLRQVGGVVLVILGLNLMGVLRLQRLSRSWKPFERFGGEQVVDPAVISETRTAHNFRPVSDRAKELNADLIVMTTHGWTGLKHFFLGSVAEKIVRKAPCSVLTIRPHDPGETS